MSVLQFGLPLGVAIIRPDVGWVIAALAVTRVVWMLLWLTQLHRLLPRVPGIAASHADLRHALHFGGWLSVSNLIGPLMVYADRFYLASVFPPATVAYYTVPFDTAFRATSLPQMAANALFPALAETQSRPEASTRLLALAIRAVVVLVLTQLLNIILVPLLQHAALTLTISLGALMNALWLLIGLIRRGSYKPLAGWAVFAARVLGATALMAAFLYWGARYVDWVAVRGLMRAGLMSAFVAGAAVIYFGALLASGLKLRQLLRR